MATDTPINVLLIEDNPTDVRLVQEILRGTPDYHFNIIPAPTLAKGLGHLASDRIDIVLLDLGLPDSQGFDTFQAVEKQAPDLPVIILTVSATEELGFKAIHAGAQRFFSKDVLTPDGAYAEMFPQIIRYAIEHKRVEAELQQQHKRVQRLNEELEAKTEELRAVNEELEKRVEERTAELTEIAAWLKHEVAVRQQAEATIKHRARELEIINDIITIGNTARDLSTLLSEILTKTLDFTDFEIGHVRLLRNSTLTLECAHGLPPEYLEKQREISIDDPLYAAILRTRRLRFEEDFKGVDPVRARTSSLQTAGAVPLVAGQEVIGIIGVGSRHYRRLSKGQKTVLTMIGQEAGTVIAKMQTEEALKESEARLNKLVEQSFDAVFIHSGGIIRFANGVAARILKAARPEDLVGLDALAFPTDEFHELVKERIASIYETRTKTEPEEMQFKTVDGGVVDVESMATGTVWEGKPAVYVAFRDITEKKRAEKELKRYAERLEDLVEERTGQLKDAERLAAIGQTAAMIGHDLRNPLQAIQLTVDLGKKYYDALTPDEKARFESSTARRTFSNIEKQIQYMDKIVSDLQDYSRPLQPEPERIYIAAFVADTLALIAIPESTIVHVDVPGSLIAEIDLHLMQRALANLVLNAVQAMPQSGELTVGGAVIDGEVTLTVQDTGEGVAENMKETLFSPLTTGKAKGSGLGLAVVKRIVEAHNGTISFESEAGKGTTFIVTLPQKGA